MKVNYAEAMQARLQDGSAGVKSGPTLRQPWPESRPTLSMWGVPDGDPTLGLSRENST